MKIGILTHPLEVNYGGILQAYALSTILTEMGHNVEVLKRVYDKPLCKRILIMLLTSLGHTRYNNPKYKNLRRFVSEHIHYTRPMHTSRQLSSYVKSHGFNAVIVGSDQVWRSDFAMSFGFDYFLDFVPAGVSRLSYAASFGLSDWLYTSEQTLRIKNLLNTFKAVSIRETSGRNICSEHLDIQAEVVLDPTLLLTAEHYSELASPKLLEVPYVFVYWLGSEEGKRDALLKINSKKYNVIDISLRGDDTLISIEDWLSYIRYADFVVTDSFHGCVFSILFEKPFTICANDIGGNSRLISLFEILNLDSTREINYPELRVRLEELRKSSLRFLKESLVL